MHLKKRLGRWLLGIREAEISFAISKEHDLLVANQKRLETELTLLRNELYDLILEKVVPMVQKQQARLQREKAPQDPPKRERTGLLSRDEVEKIRKSRLP